MNYLNSYLNKLLIEIKKLEESLEFLKTLNSYKGHILYKSSLQNTIERIGEILYKITKRYLLFKEGTYTKEKILDLLGTYVKNPEIIIEGRNFIAHEIYYLNEEKTVEILEEIKENILKNEENIKKFLIRVMEELSI